MAEEIQVQEVEAPAEEKAEESIYAPEVKTEESTDQDVEIVVHDDVKEDVQEPEAEEEKRLYANKYESPEDLEQAFLSLRKKLSNGEDKPPEDGYRHERLDDFEISDDDPLLTGFNELAKEEGLSQHMYNRLIDTFLDAVGAQDAQVKQTRAQVMEDLGPNAEAVVSDMQSWANGLVQSGVWTAEEYAWFTSAADSSAGTRALQKVRESYADRIPMKAQPSTTAGQITKAELDGKMAEKDDNGEMRYATDPVFRAEVDKLVANSPNLYNS